MQAFISPNVLKAPKPYVLGTQNTRAASTDAAKPNNPPVMTGLTKMIAKSTLSFLPYDSKLDFSNYKWSGSPIQIFNRLLTRRYVCQLYFRYNHGNRKFDFMTNTLP